MGRPPAGSIYDSNIMPNVVVFPGKGLSSHYSFSSFCVDWCSFHDNRET